MVRPPSRSAAAKSAENQMCPFCRAPKESHGARCRPHSLSKDSKESLAWLLSCVQATPTKPLSDPRLFHCVSAADAVAVERRHNRHRRVAMRQRWPTLLLRDLVHVGCSSPVAHSRLGHKYLSFAMPEGSDNTPTEAGVNKLFSTAFLSASFCSS